MPRIPLLKRLLSFLEAWRLSVGDAIVIGDFVLLLHHSHIRVMHCGRRTRANVTHGGFICTYTNIICPMFEAFLPDEIDNS